MSDASQFKGKKGLVRLWNATGYSRDGLLAAWRHEAAFREEVLLAAVAIPLAFYFGKTGVDRALLVGSIVLILIVEILNSGLEAVVDKASPESTTSPNGPRTWAARRCCCRCSTRRQSGRWCCSADPRSVAAPVAAQHLAGDGGELLVEFVAQEADPER